MLQSLFVWRRLLTGGTVIPVGLIAVVPGGDYFTERSATERNGTGLTERSFLSCTGSLVLHWFQQLKQLVHLSSFPRNMLQEYLACYVVPLLTQ